MFARTTIQTVVAARIARILRSPRRVLAALAFAGALNVGGCSTGMERMFIHEPDADPVHLPELHTALDGVAVESPIRVA